MIESEQPAPGNKGPEASLQIIDLGKFSSVDFEAPIAVAGNVDCMKLGHLFGKAFSAEKEVGNTDAAEVFQLLQSVCQIHFKPNDRAEPYGPMAVFDGKRSVIPSDLEGEQSDVFAELAPKIQNPGLRARLADIVWFNDRKQVASAQLAIGSYCESVQLVVDGKAQLYLEKQNAASHSACGKLRRACQIATATGWKEPEAAMLKTLITMIEASAHQTGDCSGHLHIGDLSLDYGIGDAVTIAKNAESLATIEKLDPHLSRELWELAARVYHQAKQPDENNRSAASAAECYVTMAAAANYKGMTAASWLMDAIKALQQVPKTKERREELEGLLREAQASIADEMGAVSTEIDISDLVDHARKSVADLTLAQALAEFASLDRSPQPQKLREDVEKQAAENPLSSIIPMTIHDDEGKVVSKSPGLALGEEKDDTAVLHLIARNEGMRRQIAVSGMFEPARRLIMSEHPLNQSHFEPIVAMSPFVPADRTDLYALGFARYFNGDFISALHILIPQLENSLRYVLKQAGVDASKIQNDMTQENRTLPIMLVKDREALEKIFCEAIVFEIDNLFLFKGGPTLRHQVAHGMISGGACYSPDAIYACWFIFRLCCLPLFRHWKQVMDAMADR